LLSHVDLGMKGSGVQAGLATDALASGLSKAGGLGLQRQIERMVTMASRAGEVSAHASAPVSGQVSKQASAQESAQESGPATRITSKASNESKKPEQKSLDGAFQEQVTAVKKINP